MTKLFPWEAKQRMNWEDKSITVKKTETFQYYKIEFSISRVIDLLWLFFCYSAHREKKLLCQMSSSIIMIALHHTVWLHSVWKKYLIKSLISSDLLFFLMKTRLVTKSDRKRPIFKKKFFPPKYFQTLCSLHRKSCRMSIWVVLLGKLAVLICVCVSLLENMLAHIPSNDHVSIMTMQNI